MKVCIHTTGILVLGAPFWDLHRPTFALIQNKQNANVSGKLPGESSRKKNEIGQIKISDEIKPVTDG